MSTTDNLQATPVGTLVARNPARARAFEALGIDYCCGGKATLADACASKRLDLASVVALLQALDAASGSAAAPVAPGAQRDLTAVPLADLADEIERTHHAYIRAELPRLDRLTERVLKAHGDRDPRLAEVRRIFLAMKDDLESHIEKEELVLFPIVRELEGTGASTGHSESLRAPLERLEREHQEAGDALAALRAATDNYTPTANACNTWRVMLDTLAAFERDMHEHVHKENSVLFPRALALEESLEAARAGG